MVVPRPASPPEVMSNAVCTSPAGVVVEIKSAGAVEVAVRDRVAAGVVVPPRPRLPWLLTMSMVVVAGTTEPVDEAMVKRGVPAPRPGAPATESRAQGDEVPMPKRPLVASRLRKFAEDRVVAPE